MSADQTPPLSLRRLSFLKSLPYFLAAGEEQNLHRAAERLNIAQPALSRRIQDLEEDLGVALFQRLPRGLQLTEAGRILLDGARDALVLAERARTRTQLAAGGHVGRISVAFNEVAARHRLVLDTFRAFRAAFPEVALDLLPMNSEPQLEAIRTGKLDAGFLNNRPVDSGDYGAHLVELQSLVLALPSFHKLLKRDEIRLSDLVDEPFVWHKTPLAFSNDVLTKACHNAGLSPRIVQEAADGDMLLSLVSIGMGIGFVDSAAKCRWEDSVVFRPIADLCIPMRLEFVWSDSNVNPVLKNFVSIFAATLPLPSNK